MTLEKINSNRFGMMPDVRLQRRAAPNPKVQHLVSFFEQAQNLKNEKNPFSYKQVLKKTPTRIDLKNFEKVLEAHRKMSSSPLKITENSEIKPERDITSKPAPITPVSSKEIYSASISNKRKLMKNLDRDFVKMSQEIKKGLQDVKSSSNRPKIISFLANINLKPLGLYSDYIRQYIQENRFKTKDLSYFLHRAVHFSTKGDFNKAFLVFGGVSSSVIQEEGESKKDKRVRETAKETLSRSRHYQKLDEMFTPNFGYKNLKKEIDVRVEKNLAFADLLIPLKKRLTSFKEGTGIEEVRKTMDIDETISKFSLELEKILSFYL